MDEKESNGRAKLSLEELAAAYPRSPPPPGWEDWNPDYYRRQLVTVKTDGHNATGEPDEMTIPLFQIGFIVAYQRILSIDESKKSARLKQLQELMWQTMTEDWGVDKWTWRSGWYVVGFDPPEPR
jgi:hypothetical protein